MSFLAYSCSADGDKNLSIKERGNYFNLIDNALNQPKLDIDKALMRIQLSGDLITFWHIHLERKISFIFLWHEHEFVYTTVYMGGHRTTGDICILFLPSMFQKLNSGINAWWQTLFCTELSSKSRQCWFDLHWI